VIFFAGTYSSIAVGSSPADIRECGRPEGRIHFAGEHTSTTHQGAVHGAYPSGIRAANEILAVS